MSEKSEKQLSDEFKKDIKEKRNTNNLLGTFLAFLAIILVFGTVGVAGYQMLFGPEKIENKSASEKIESRPEEKKETQAVTPEVTAPAPAATTPTAPATAPASTSKSYTIVSGDTWSSVANANGISSAKLMEYNGTTSEDLQIGQTIKLP
jgi:cytoskeletal protein RodZ